jgi:LysM repeat protein
MMQGQGPRDFTNALVIALVSAGLVLGALSISLVEFGPAEVATPTSSLIPSPAPLTATSTPAFVLSTITPSFTPLVASTSTVLSSCPIPSGWTQTIVQAGETVESIATRYRIGADDLRRGNCLFSSTLVPGSRIYVPSVAPSTSVACVQGAAGWSKSYVVKAGDNLYRIGVDHYTTLDLMRKVNCKTSDTIFPGDLLWVPVVSATRTLNPTSLPGSTATPYPTDPLTETPLPFTATFAPTNTLVPTSTVTIASP